MLENQEIDHRMLEALRTKEQWVLKTQRETGKDLSAALDEVKRQIRQVLAGEKVTKSDGTYGSD